MIELEENFLRIALQRNLKLDWCLVQESPATPCDPAFTALLQSATGFGQTLVSGAGHDGVALASAMPIAMLFIRCRDGLSHHPDEYASAEDIATGIDILARFLTSLPA